MSDLKAIITINGTDRIQQYEELVKVFLQPSEYRISAGDDTLHPETEDDGSYHAGSLFYSFEGDADALKRQIWHDLSNLTGKSPKWGVLTGIRPVKLADELGKRDGSADAAGVRDILLSRYLLHPSKADLTMEILDFQKRIAGEPAPDSLSVYVGIPFCPSRCLYCSFTSNQAGDEEIERYLGALKKEIAYAGRKVREEGFQIESVYIGGGTPASPQAPQLDQLLEAIRLNFDLSGCREFTVEAGRADAITEEKLQIMKAHGVDRISINPQSMKQKTLDLIGRKHTTDDVRRAFALAKAVGFRSINSDLIAGLPEELPEDFMDSLEQMLRLGADNITLHTLAVKRASRLKERDENFNYRDEQIREEMLRAAEQRLRRAHFRPYYLYRQKHTSGNTENIGYCLDDRLSLYNVRIMEEHQSILALGAGGISKIYFPAENRLERVANVSNYEIYIDRIDEMIRRKEEKFFGQNR